MKYSKSQVNASPLASVGLIGLTALAFLIEVSMTPGLRASWVMAWGATPDDFARLSANVAPPGTLFTLITSQFLHLGWYHFLWNTLALLAAGPAVEARLGRPLFVALYLVSGATGTVVHSAFAWAPSLALLGGSSSAAGVLGSYVLSHWSRRILFRVPLTTALWRMPVWGLTLIWIAGQWLSGFLAIVPAQLAAPPTFWAIGGGLVAGVILHWPLSRLTQARRAPRRPAVVHYNPYDNPDEEYRPLGEANARQPYDNEDEEA